MAVVGLFDAGGGAVAGLLGDRSGVQAMLDTEVAPALACTDVGLVPVEHADAIPAAGAAGEFVGRALAEHERRAAR